MELPTPQENRQILRGIAFGVLSIIGAIILAAVLAEVIV